MKERIIKKNKEGGFLLPYYTRNLRYIRDVASLFELIGVAAPYQFVFFPLPTTHLHTTFASTTLSLFSSAFAMAFLLDRDFIPFGYQTKCNFFLGPIIKCIQNAILLKQKLHAFHNTAFSVYCNCIYKNNKQKKKEGGD